MKIVAAESLHADGGYRACSFLKLTTDEGLVGWSEYYDSFSGARIEPLIQDFAMLYRSTYKRYREVVKATGFTAED